MCRVESGDNPACIRRSLTNFHTRFPSGDRLEILSAVTPHGNIPLTINGPRPHICNNYPAQRGILGGRQAIVKKVFSSFY